MFFGTAKNSEKHLGMFYAPKQFPDTSPNPDWKSELLEMCTADVVKPPSINSTFSNILFKASENILNKLTLFENAKDNFAPEFYKIFEPEFISKMKDLENTMNVYQFDLYKRDDTLWYVSNVADGRCILKEVFPTTPSGELFIIETYGLCQGGIEHVDCKLQNIASNLIKVLPIFCDKATVHKILADLGCDEEIIMFTNMPKPLQPVDDLGEVLSNNYSIRSGERTNDINIYFNTDYGNMCLRLGSYLSCDIRITDGLPIDHVTYI